MAYNFVRLYQLTKKTKYKEQMNRQFDFMRFQVSDYPAGHSLFLIAELIDRNPPEQVKIVLDKAGDMSVLFGNNGYAFSVFLTNRFRLSDVIGKTVIIHKDPDDYITQPSGNAGEKIACGVIGIYKNLHT